MIIDAHCDTLLKVTYEDSYSLRENTGHLSLNMLKNSDALCQFFAIYIERELMNIKSSYEIFSDMYEKYMDELKLNDDIIKPVYRGKDILNNYNDGKLSALLSIEDAVCAQGKLERIEEFYKKGVRAIALLWNFENELGYPNSINHKEHMKGLKAFGKDAVLLMNDLGIIVDVSHLSEGGFYDVADISKSPFMATHSCARALCNHQRNLTDDQIRVLGNKGGVIGVNFEASFLTYGSTHGTNKEIIEHIRYMVNIGGIDAVGFGSDFDGIDDAGEINNYNGYAGLIDQLGNYFSDDEIDKICYKNELRLIKEVIK
jgi:membrane dipeptidase